MDRGGPIAVYAAADNRTRSHGRHIVLKTRLALATAAVLLAAAAPQPPGAGTPAQTPAPLLTPVVPACVSSPFGPRVLANRPLAGTFHPGIDLPAREGAPVRAIAPGHIIRIQRKGRGGLEMMIQHNGLVGVYSHLGHVAPVIAAGRMVVSAGQTIGTVGRSGLTYGMHLYFGILRDGQPIDPTPLLAVQPCGSPTRPKAQGERLQLSGAPPLP